jgi:transcriptional regulator with XRE-family HTH domain
MAFGLVLARLRRSRSWSQEELAQRAGVSQRHLSFLETGRAFPGQRSLQLLIEALALRGWEQRTLLAALAPSPQPICTPVPDDALVAHLAETLSPWPAYAFRPDGSVLHVNGAMTGLLAMASPGEDLWQMTAPQEGANVYDLALHPDGLLRWMDNPEEVVPETVRRLRIEATGDPAIMPVVKRLEAYPSARTYIRSNAVPPAVLIERYRIGERVLRLIPVVSQLASPGEIEFDQLRMETFVPFDAESEEIIRGR